MGKKLEALQNLQSIESQLAVVRRRLKSRRNAVALQKQRIERLRSDWEALHEKLMAKRMEADRLDVDLREKEELVTKRRGFLNTARTNKEYAAILTEMNTIKADNARIEEEALKALQDADVVHGEADQIQSEIDVQTQHLDEIQKSSEEEVVRLDAMQADLLKQRSEVVTEVDPEGLAIFERIVETYDGQAMAAIEIHGRKAPFSYVCGGCYMGLNAEHANALRVRDEIRTCDNCGRILCLKGETQDSPAT